MNIDPGFNSVPRPMRPLLEKVVVPLVVIHDKKLIGVGTGTIVSGLGILLTAKHVVRAAAVYNGELPQDPEAISAGTELYAMYRSHEYPEDPNSMFGGLTRIVKIWSAIELDIAYCLLQPMVEKATGKHYEWPHVSIYFSKPKIGQRCLAFGYPLSAGTVDDDGRGGAYEDDLVGSDGIIEDVFPEKRDSVMLKFPSFHVATEKYQGGMSGGPIFVDGFVGVAGIVSSGLDEGLGGGAMVWPSLGIEMDLWPPRKTTVVEAAMKGFIPAHSDIETFTIDDGPGTADKVYKLKVDLPKYPTNA
ncbi:MAG: hypothetical protein JWN01_366 [Patescibacteria group bacterium]|nr:hypothetical protein [Patescibacteria group bacterium]